MDTNKTHTFTTLNTVFNLNVAIVIVIKTILLRFAAANTLKNHTTQVILIDRFNCAHFTTKHIFLTMKKLKSGRKLMGII